MNDIRFPLPVKLVDYGTAPEVYADGLARVEQLGAATLFALYRLKTTIVDGQSQQVREVMQHIIMPTDAVGPAVELTLLTFGTELLIPSAGYALRRRLS
jgi:hypothetical protein